MGLQAEQQFLREDTRKPATSRPGKKQRKRVGSSKWRKQGKGFQAAAPGTGERKPTPSEKKKRRCLHEA